MSGFNNDHGGVTTAWADLSAEIKAEVVETGRGSYVCQGLLDRKTCEGERALRSWWSGRCWRRRERPWIRSVW